MNKTLSEIIKESKVSSFEYFRNGFFYYKTDKGHEFCIPFEDVSGTTLKGTDKTIFFMRWIRKSLEVVKSIQMN